MNFGRPSDLVKFSASCFQFASHCFLWTMTTIRMIVDESIRPFCLITVLIHRLVSAFRCYIAICMSVMLCLCATHHGDVMFVCLFLPCCLYTDTQFPNWKCKSTCSGSWLPNEIFLYMTIIIISTCVCVEQKVFWSVFFFVQVNRNASHELRTWCVKI